MWDIDDTIAALATPRGGGYRGILRVSGPRLFTVLSPVLNPAATWDEIQRSPAAVWPANCAASESLGDVPCELYVWPTERSYTRQPSAEIHTVGSPPILDAILERLCRQGARLARPGEFTLRAFLAGRLDLTQAEAVLGVIDAASQAELDTALTQLAGGVAGPLQQLRHQLLDLLAHLEAGLDFVEEDIQFISPEELSHELTVGIDRMEQLLRQFESRGLSEAEPRVVLRGLPNAGKSSLFNAILGTDRSIVSPQPATTRDYVSASCRWGDLVVRFIDTAGVDEATPRQTIESAAQRQTASQTSRADVELLCLDSTRPLTDWEQKEFLHPPVRRRIVVWTKCDELPEVGPVSTLPNVHAPWEECGVPRVLTSSRTGRGLESLAGQIAREVAAARSTESAVVQSTAIRCRESLTRAVADLRRAERLAVRREGEELVAAELRHALHELGEVVGVVYTDDILDRVFSRFCIGK